MSATCVIRGCMCHSLLFEPSRKTEWVSKPLLCECYESVYTEERMVPGKHTDGTRTGNKARQTWQTIRLTAGTKP